MDLDLLHPVSYRICIAGNKYLHPGYTYIANAPFVSPLASRLEEKVGFSDKLSRFRAGIEIYDQNFKITSSIHYVTNTLAKTYNKLSYNYFVNLHPTVSKYWAIFKIKSDYYGKIALVHLRYHGSITLGKLQIGKNQILSSSYNHLKIFIDKLETMEAFSGLFKLFRLVNGKMLEYIQIMRIKLYDFYIVLVRTFQKLNVNFDFIQKQWNKVIGSFSIDPEVTEVKKQQKQDDLFQEGIENLNEFDIIDDISSSIIDVPDLVDDDSDFEDEEPITVQLTSIITITSSQDDSLPTDNDESSEPKGIIDLTEPMDIGDELSINGPGYESAINEELNIWEQKVNNTLRLANKNLEFDMEPIIEDILNKIKSTVSEKMTNIQITNYDNYQKLNVKIGKINKDYLIIYETNDISIKTVTRQEIRDDISDCYKFDEEISNEIQKILIENHELILKEYFNKLQDTIDILESFSESAVESYSKKMTNLFTELDIVDDTVIWKSWKKFYKIKDEIFKYRNKLFDDAYEYKKRDLKSINVEIVGLNEWNHYLSNINFHLNFISNDNDEYMKLIRAQANIAFQVRESLVMEIEKKNEEREREREEETRGNGENLQQINTEERENAQQINEERVNSQHGTERDNVQINEERVNVQINTNNVQINEEREINERENVQQIDTSQESKSNNISNNKSDDLLHTVNQSRAIEIKSQDVPLADKVKFNRDYTDEDYENHLSDDELTDDD